MNEFHLLYENESYTHFLFYPLNDRSAESDVFFDLILQITFKQLDISKTKEKLNCIYAEIYRTHRIQGLLIIVPGIKSQRAQDYKHRINAFMHETMVNINININLILTLILII